MAEIKDLKDMDPGKDVYEPIPCGDYERVINRDGLWYDKPKSKILAEMLGACDDFSGEEEEEAEEKDNEWEGEVDEAPEFAVKPSEISIEEYRRLAVLYLQRKHHCLPGEAADVVEDNEDDLQEWYKGNKTIADNYYIWDIYFAAEQAEALHEAVYNQARKLKWQIMRGEKPRSEWTAEMSDSYGELPPLQEKP